MFFIFSKLLVFFIKPFNVIVLLLILSFVLRSKVWKKRLRLLALGLFLFFSNGLIYNECLRVWEIPAIAIQDLPGQYEYAIVLGGTADTKREPKDRLFLRKGGERITHATNLYQAAKVKKILFTGGESQLFEDPEKDNSPISEFYEMCGVQPEDIILENRARNTHENALLTKEKIDSLHIEKPSILVTSAFHMRRSLACFQKQGIDVVPFSCDFHTSLDEDRFEFGMFIPSGEVLISWDFFIKELIGIIAYKLAGYI